MRTVVLGARPAALESLIARRRELGLDGADELWEGEYHMAPAAHPAHGIIDNELAVLLDPPARKVGLIGTGPFNLGESTDYRVPDRGFHRVVPDSIWVPTAAVVIEIVSPDDETWDKLGFYAGRGVDEVMIVDPSDQSVSCLSLDGGGYGRSGASRLLGISAADITQRILWPTTR
ncbi:MAG: Uma2 family endonuclease [Actinomycetota bacterium]|nr:Uma2 family endonuclease [Actinomycetota bacterium]